MAFHFGRRVSLRAVAFLGLTVLAPALRAQAWQVDPSFAPQLLDESAASSTLRIFPLPDGQMLVRGTYQYINESPVPSGFNRLRADGAWIDSLSGPPTNLTSLRTLVQLSDGRFLGLADFYLAPGPNSSATIRTRLIRLNPDGTLDDTYVPPAIAGTFADLRFVPLNTGTALVAGFYSGIGGNARVRLARLRPDGALDLSFTADLGTSPVALTALAPLPDGRLLVAANAIEGPALVRKLWRLHSDGSRDPTFTPASPSRTTAVLIVTEDGRVLSDGYDQPLVRLTSLGSRDPTFAWRGAATDSVAHALPFGRNRTVVELANAQVVVLDESGAPLLDLRTPLGAAERVSLVVSEASGNVLISHAARSPSSGFGPTTPVDPGINVRPSNPGPPVLTGALPAQRYPLAGATLRRLRSDLTLDPSFAARFAVIGSATSVSVDAADRVTTTGNFDRVNGQPRYGFARFLSDGSLDPSAPPSPVPTGPAVPVVSPPVFDIPTGYIYTPSPPVASEADGSRLVGEFVDARSWSYRLVRISADGLSRVALPAEFDFSPNIATTGGRPVAVSSIYPLPDRKILVSGGFYYVNRTVRPRLARLTADGALDNTYVPAAIPFIDGPPQFISLNGGRVLLSGRPATLRGSPASLLRLRADGSLDTTFGTRPDPGSVLIGEQPDGSLLFGDAWLNPDGSADLNFARAAAARPSASSVLQSAPGRLYLGGSFSMIGGQPRTCLARLIRSEVVGITVPPRSQTVPAGRSITLESALGTNQPATYRWTHNGTTLPGATSSTLALPSVQRDQAGEYRVVATIAGQTHTSAPATLTVARSDARLANFSALSRIRPDSAQFVGFVLAPAVPRQVFLRSLALTLPDPPDPSVAVAVGIGGQPLIDVLTGPASTTHQLSLYSGNQLLGQDRGSALAAPITALASLIRALPPVYPTSVTTLAAGLTHGSALAPLLSAGHYVAVTTPFDDRPSRSLFECYDTGDHTVAPLLQNVSVLGRAGLGHETLTLGFVITGRDPLRLLVRGIGPALTTFGIGGALPDPSLSVTTSPPVTVYSSAIAYEPFADPWRYVSPFTLSSTSVALGDTAPNATENTAAARAAGAFPLPATSRDTAVLLTLEPGAYTAQLSSASGQTGTAMIEVYVVEN